MAEKTSGNLYEWLQQVRQRPGMYVREWSLDELHAMCHGYSVALSTHGIEEFGTRFNGRFGDYLLDQYGWSMSRGWAKGIREMTRNPEEAFYRFFELVEEFRQHLTKDRQ